MAHSEGIQWTNKSVLRLAAGENPISVLERKTRELVLEARDRGWKGPPFNPLAIADLLGIPVEATADVADARIAEINGGLKIQFNPTQARERVRFSIAHELAHSLFPDVADEVRHRGGTKMADDWQLEMLCNLAAAEFVMPVGSLPPRERVPPIEELMRERRRFDVSAEAFLIRITKIARDPIVMFCASPINDNGKSIKYRIDYTFQSNSAPSVPLSGKVIPRDSIVYLCTAIGYTDSSAEEWFSLPRSQIECVGISAYPGASFPRVAGLMRIAEADARKDPIKVVQGDVLDPRGSEPRIVCQLVNDQARTWGGGVAKAAARKFPRAQAAFSEWLPSIPRAQRLGKVHCFTLAPALFIASLVAQEGYGASDQPRVRYAALERCFEQISQLARDRSASVHMPRIGSGGSGGSWDTVEEMIRETLVADEVEVTVYDLPPKRMPQSPGLFD